MSSAAPHVLILGAGINGCAIARDLAINGIAVTIVDRGDIASGATAYSSRLIHGGLRYLEFGEFDLVRESLDERGRLLRLASDYVRPLELMIPVSGRTGGWWSSALRFLTGGRMGARSKGPRGLWLVRMGLGLYDRYARDEMLPKHSTHRVGEANTPPVDASAYRWLCAYWDAQVEFPERFTLAMLDDARAAAKSQGVPFHVYTYRRVHRSDGSLTILPTHEHSDAAPLRIEPDLIINATGASVDRALGDLSIDSPPLMGPTKGSHFVTRNAKLIAALGGRGIYAEAADGRPVFVLPLGDAVLVGTTDIPFGDDPATAVATQDELDYLVSTVRELFPNLGFARSDIDFHYSGVRPLPRSDAASTAGVTRRHAIVEHDPAQVADKTNAPPILSVIGGKLTTCRALAEIVTDRVLAKLGSERKESTRDRPFRGAGGGSAKADELAARFNLTPAQIAAVRKLLGGGTEGILAEIVAELERYGPLAESLDGCEIPKAVARWSIEHEWARTIGDLVERRLMLLYHERLTKTCLTQLAELLVEQGLLAHDRIEAEVARTIERLKEHYGKQVH
jgi:glycerol-3-phosphate dehydrogenase